MNTEKTDDKSKQLEGLVFDIDKSMRYHQWRRAHYERLHSMFMFLIIIFGSSAFADIGGNHSVFGLLSAAAGALDLVLALGTKARDHELLYRRFSELQKFAIAANPEDFTILKRDRLDIEADEPPTYWALEQLAYNQALIANGYDVKHLNDISWFKSAFGNFLRFDSLSATAS